MAYGKATHVRCWLCKQENLSFSPHHLPEKSSSITHVHARVGMAGGADPGSAI